MMERQSSQLLPGLFEATTDEQRFSVLHLGPILPETLDYFSGQRCKLYVNDLFAELPLGLIPGEEPTVQQRIGELCAFPEGVRFDLCLFWDLFNYLDEAAILALMDCLRPHLAPGARAHAFGVHNIRSPEQKSRFGVVTESELVVRERAAKLQGYAPHTQAKLKQYLDGFEVKRSVLLAQSRLELLLQTKS